MGGSAVMYMLHKMHAINGLLLA